MQLGDTARTAARGSSTRPGGGGHFSNYVFLTSWHAPNASSVLPYPARRIVPTVGQFLLTHSMIKFSPPAGLFYVCLRRGLSDCQLSLIRLRSMLLASDLRVTATDHPQSLTLDPHPNCSRDAYFAHHVDWSPSHPVCISNNTRPSWNPAPTTDPCVCARARVTTTASNARYHAVRSVRSTVSVYGSWAANTPTRTRTCPVHGRVRRTHTCCLDPVIIVSVRKLSYVFFDSS